MQNELCPAQGRALQQLRAVAERGNVLVLMAEQSLGRTTVLREAGREWGAAWVGMKELVEAMQSRHPLALEETLYALVWEALKSKEVVIVDDVHVLHAVVSSGCRAYPRAEYLGAPLIALCTYAAESGKRLVLGAESYAPWPVSHRCTYARIAEFKSEDYEFLCRAMLGAEKAAGLDYRKIHRFAPKLNVHQLKGACAWLGRNEGALTTDVFIEYLRSQRMASNVDLGEVRAVDLRDLKGVDDVIESLEANIIVPMENDRLAEELKIKPKRGVLIAGPPGTGKTTIGRALAHRLKSKFFLIDGTFISGTSQFYGQVHQVFEAAKHNAPAIIFIDDSDVIFETGEEAGLYRYLLTMLDGLESESAGRVCVMLTAMDVGSLPPALVRSGRVELWLETRLPDEGARTAILSEGVRELPGAMGEVDVAEVAGATEGLTGADLKRLLEDGKLLFAYDKVRGERLRPATEYLKTAAETVRVNKARYAEAEASARRQRPQRPAWFDVMTSGAFEAGVVHETVVKDF